MKKLLTLTLTVLLILPTIAFGGPAQNQTLKDARKNVPAQKPKLAPDLEEILAQDDQQALTLGQLRQNRLAAKAGTPPEKEAPAADEQTRVNGVTLPSLFTPAEEKQSFIVQMNGTTPDVVLQEKLALLGGRISQKQNEMGLVTIQAPRTAIRQLAADGNIAYVSPDRLVESTNWHLQNTTGFNNPGIVDKGDSDPNTWLDSIEQ